MSLSIAHLGPRGTNAETAAAIYKKHLRRGSAIEIKLCPYPGIAQTLWAVAQQTVDLAVVPVENSIEGSVAITLDTLWQVGTLKIHQALELPISHALLSWAQNLSQIRQVYSHPQALGQCQKWLDQHLPQVQLIASSSTTEAIQHLDPKGSMGAIASPRAGQLYQIPLLAPDINDYPDNCTRFWVVSLKPSLGGSHTSLAFSLPANVPGVLVKPLQTFAQREINLSRIESRPTKQSFGTYLFFIDIEADVESAEVQAALAELSSYTETLKIFGSYTILNADLGASPQSPGEF
ncbi:MAG: prephenate dehydratase [Oscillatoriales cyanobacterium RM1_1_9]|nr:prephenate dehydratase [Oscillatoriales cyanobacterium SM2_3_0]NJO44691.1 prephenate dehydratase [Oscillatoriales cyanobacterium RM2_1_1]NJO71844.1 prephenate dehydratase [Oscillatoriales cyanobacterium RM1_1_9]